MGKYAGIMAWLEEERRKENLQSSGGIDHGQEDTFF